MITGLTIITIGRTNKNTINVVWEMADVEIQISQCFFSYEDHSTNIPVVPNSCDSFVVNAFL